MTDSEALEGKLLMRPVLSILVLCLAVMLTPGAVTSKSTNYEQTSTEIIMIADSIIPANLRWLNQESQLVFLDASSFGSYVSIELANPDWYLYDAQQETLTQTNIWPAQPDIPCGLIDKREPDSMAFLSPTGRYLAFMSIKPIDSIIREESFMAVYDFDSHTIIETNLSTGYGGVSSVVGFTEVTWSDEGAFVLAFTPSEGGLAPLSILYYVDLQKVAVDFQQISVFQFENRTHIVRDVFDVSADGRQVLLGVGDSLVLWDVQEPNELTFIPEVDGSYLLDAHFLSMDQSELVFFNDLGVGHYTMSTGAINIITDQVSSTDYRMARFSPNEGALAFADDTSVYWIDLKN